MREGRMTGEELHRAYRQPGSQQTRDSCEASYDRIWTGIPSSFSPGLLPSDRPSAETRSI